MDLKNNEGQLLTPQILNEMNLDDFLMEEVNDEIYSSLIENKKVRFEPVSFFRRLYADLLIFNSKIQDNRPIEVFEEYYEYLKGNKYPKGYIGFIFSSLHKVLESNNKNNWKLNKISKLLDKEKNMLANIDFWGGLVSDFKKDKAEIDKRSEEREKRWDKLFQEYEIGK